MDNIELSASMLLKNLDWSCLSSEQIFIARGKEFSEVILTTILRHELRKRRYTHNNVERHFSEGVIENVITRLRYSMLNQSLSVANEKIYNYLVYGVSVIEFIDGKKINLTLQIIDWSDIKNNSFVFTHRMPVSNIADGVIHRLNIVCFLNGLPVVVIEGRSTDSYTQKKESINEVIANNIRNQQSDRIPQIFIYTQILFAINGDDGRYGTQGLSAKFWVPWHEKDISEEEFYVCKNKLIDKDSEGIYPAYRVDKNNINLSITEQDKLLISLLSHRRLLEIIKSFISFDKKKGKIIARHQQFFAVKHLVHNIESNASPISWQGGVIWHTAGSGKSLTILFLTKTLVFLESLKKYKIIIVTDRVDLEAQLSKTFSMSSEFYDNKHNLLAKSGKQLAERISNSNERIIFSIINKFATASKLPECHNNSSNIIVLVDEGHRSQGGKNYKRMRRTLPNAIFVAFTGTPLLKDDKTTNKFGPIVHAYTMQRAISDKAVTPLLYEERLPLLELNEQAIDRWFSRITVGLSDFQKSELKQRLTRTNYIYHSEDRIRLIAYDIANHFFKNIHKDLKGQVACDSKLSAIKYKQFIDELGLFESAIVMSSPHIKKTNGNYSDPDIPEVVKWWKQNVGSQDELSYTKEIVNRFSHYEEPRMLIVVDKLLTGFDEPRNTVLYIDKPLKGHNLMQAVTRVNRVHPQKRFGLLIDYRGILAELDTTIAKYQDLANRTQGGFDISDIKGLYYQMSVEYRRLPDLHKRLWNIFKDVSDKSDIEQLRQVIIPQLQQQDSKMIDMNMKNRENFEIGLREFTDCLKIALQSANFNEDTSFSEDDRKQYKKTINQFAELRQIIRTDLDQVVDNDEYESHIKTIVNQYIEGIKIKEPKNMYKISDVKAVDDPCHWSDEKIRNESNIIKNRVTYTIEKNLINEPYTQQVFSALLKKIINQTEAFFNHPLKQYQLLNVFKEKVEKRLIDGLPDKLSGKQYAQNYYGILMINLGKDSADINQHTSDRWVELSLKADKIVTNALAENSLNAKNTKSQIRKYLMPMFFYESKLHGFHIDKAKAIVERIVQTLVL